jgi:hypothetical protein
MIDEETMMRILKDISNIIGGEDVPIVNTIKKMKDDVERYKEQMLAGLETCDRIRQTMAKEREEHQNHVQRMQKALARPCLKCGYQPNQIIPAEGNNGQNGNR